MVYLKALSRKSWDYFRRVGREFIADLHGAALLARENKITFLASGVAFFAVFSLCPFMIVSFLASRALLRNVSTMSDTPAQLNDVLNGVLPSLDPNLATQVLELLRQNTATSLFNIFVLVWSAYELFRSMNYAFENLCVEGRKRNALWENIVAACCFFIVVSIATFLLFVTTQELTSLKAQLGSWFENWDIVWFRIGLGSVSLALVIGGITLIYKVMPTEKIRWSYALLGSLLFFFLFLFGRTCFAAYGDQYRMLNQPFYGPFVTFIMVSVWIYYLCFIFLFSAQYAIYLESEKKHSK